jgi:IclR family transcriptional regulator, acetate operon repressor
VSVKSAKRILDIFELYARSRAPATLTAIAGALDVPKSSCLALLQTLESGGYIYQVQPQLGWYPTRRWLDQAQTIVEHDPLIHRVQPAMEKLRAQTGETIILARRAGERALYLIVVESEQIIRYTARAGELKPLHSTASGKALLASLDPQARRGVLERAGLRGFTARTLTTLEELEREIVRGKQRGFQKLFGEHMPDVAGASAPLRLNGDAYALTVAGPTHRIADRLEEIGALLLRACRKLESR